MRTLGALLAAAGVATVLALALGVGYLTMTGRLTRGKLARIMAVLYGIDAPAQPAAEAGLSHAVGLAVDEQMDALALRSQQLDLRERLIEGHRNSLDLERRKLQQDKEEYLAAREAFQKLQADWDGGERAQGIEEAVQLVGKLKPEQAKEQILLMLKNGELDWVVTLLRKLPPERQAKIAAEFTAPEESQRLSEILRRIRDTVPPSASTGKTPTGETARR